MTLCGGHQSPAIFFFFFFAFLSTTHALFYLSLPPFQTIVLEKQNEDGSWPRQTQ